MLPSKENTSALPSCPVCSERCWSHPRPHTRLRVCRRCRTIFNDRSDSRSAEEGQYDHCAALATVGVEQLARERWRWVQHLDGFQDSRPAVLDVGCGDGAFLRQAEASGCQVAGIELDPAAVRCCWAAGLNVIQGSLFDVELPAGPWDLITLWDVLDHLEYPVEALVRLTEHLKPGGMLVVRGRNSRIHAPLKVAYRRYSTALARVGIPDLAVVHRWGFDRAGYTSLLRKAGLGSVHCHLSAPTAGDRYGAFRRAGVASSLKHLAATATRALHKSSGGRCYPFASVLVTGTRSS